MDHQLILVITSMLLGYTSGNLGTKDARRLKVGKPRIRNVCNAEFNSEITLGIKERNYVMSSGNLKVEMQVCRSSWENGFCSSESSVHIGIACSMKAVKMKGNKRRTRYSCPIQKRSLCMLKTSGPSWGMATYLASFRVEGVDGKITEDFAFTPFLLFQQCPMMYAMLIKSSDCSDVL